MLLSLLVSACATPNGTRPVESLDYPAWLLTGERVFGEPVSADEAPQFDIDSPSAAMRDYVAELTSDSRLAAARFRRLFYGLDKDGFFESGYAAQDTLTAAETFERKTGNCLSYTSMFVALARAAGLDAVYQVVDVPPSWDADAGFLIRYTHINVLLRNVRLGSRHDLPVTIDFNVVHPDADFEHRVVSDEYARSLFYANLSVALLRENRPRESFAYLRRAIDIEPNNMDLWINLGAFYGTQGDYDASIAAYHVVLQMDPGNKPAHSGLARSYGNAGNLQMAALYQEKVRNYRETNPYYHYAMAQAAFELADYQRSLEHIDRALRLKRRTARFHLLKGLVEQQMGDQEAADASFRQAERFGLEKGVKQDLLRSLSLASTS